MSLHFEEDCPFCILHNRKTKKDSPIGKIKGEFNDENYGRGICTNDSEHQLWLFLANPRYEIFIREGIDAYIDGYYLESFMKLYQALENFRRLFVEASLFNKENRFSDILQLSHGSLRNSTFLYGAYKFAYFEFFREIPDTKNSTNNLQINSRNSIVEYRNDVVHNGKYPTKADIEQIGQIIIHYIQDIQFNFSSKINIGQEVSHPIKPGEKPPKMHFNKGLSPIIPQYSGTLFQHQVAKLHKQGDQLKCKIITDLESRLTTLNHYPDESNFKEISFCEYVKSRKNKTTSDNIY